MPTQETTKPSQSDNFSQDPAPVTVVKQPYKVLLTFKSPSRIFQKKSKEYYKNIAVLIFLLSIILVFLGQTILVLAILAFGFFTYALNSVKPEEITHKFTNKGIETIDKKFSWDQLGRFWFEKNNDQEILYIENFISLPPRLIILLGNQKKQDLKNILDKYLIEEKPELSQIEKAGIWLSNKFSLDSSNTSQNPTIKQNPPKTQK